MTNKQKKTLENPRRDYHSHEKLSENTHTLFGLSSKKSLVLSSEKKKPRRNLCNFLERALTKKKTRTNER